MITMTSSEFDRAVKDALREIPAEFRAYLDNVVIEVRDRPDRRLMREHDVPDDILGLYIGVPLEDKALEGGLPMPDRVLIFRETLLDMCASREELIEEIRITVLHEIGHHFGLDEERLEELGYD
ncbi:MAG: metallopeptidase family protein [Phycisphaerae bacterium]|nr:metallopeptidase family protein [Phycisphaerae bacterium]